jgi:hypothetical protein
VAAYADPSAPLPKDLADYFLGFTNPQAGFYNYLGQQGLAGMDQRSQFAQSQYGDEYQRYLSQHPNMPGESFMNYLNRTHPDYNQQRQAMTPAERGIMTGISTPRVRWNL